MGGVLSLFRRRSKVLSLMELSLPNYHPCSYGNRYSAGKWNCKSLSGRARHRLSHYVGRKTERTHTAPGKFQ